VIESSAAADEVGDDRAGGGSVGDVGVVEVFPVEAPPKAGERAGVAVDDRDRRALRPEELGAGAPDAGGASRFAAASPS